MRATVAAAGSAIASAEAGVFATRYDGKLFPFIPIVIAGVLAIYGIIIGKTTNAVITTSSINDILIVLSNNCIISPGTTDSYGPQITNSWLYTPKEMIISTYCIASTCTLRQHCLG